LPTSRCPHDEAVSLGVSERFHHSRSFDERIAIAFWLFVFGVVSSFLGALAAIALRVDVTTVEAGFIGAFLGSIPILALPLLARFAFGTETRLARRNHPAFRLATVGWGLLMIASRLFVGWPHAAPHSSAIAVVGLGAGVLAAWYLPHLPQALRIWAKQQHPFSDVGEA
jgi:hypothetical protein